MTHQTRVLPFQQTESWAFRMHALAVFRNLLQDPVIRCLSRFFDAPSVDAYGAFAAALYQHGAGNWSAYLLERALEDENFYMLGKAGRIAYPQSVENCLRQELNFLQELALLTPENLQSMLSLPNEIKSDAISSILPAWETDSLDFIPLYQNRLENVDTRGWGVFSRYHTFTLKQDEIIPVRSPDATTLQQLEGYRQERQLLIDNTLALLNGYPAANALLYGDAGTGKSSTVKAVVNAFQDRGLRLIEITKKQLRELPGLMDKLANNPLKFILFIDDLSFTSDDDDFAALKAILEGSVSAKSSRLVIYATSNRRHLVRETFSDREGDDVHFNDTMEELVSLSARFGLTITFQRPDKTLYLDIVQALAKQNRLLPSNPETPEYFSALESINRQAEIFALQKGGRSPRAARQFIDHLLSQL